MSETPTNEPCDCRPTGNQNGPRLSVYCEVHDGPAQDRHVTDTPRPRFTAAKVREIVNACREDSLVGFVNLGERYDVMVAMLYAFCQHLEQEEAPKPEQFSVAMGFHDPTNESFVMQSIRGARQRHDEKLREEGRREVLKEIAPLVIALGNTRGSVEAYRPMTDEFYCLMCNATRTRTGPDSSWKDYTHNPGCLWLRAQGATISDSSEKPHA